MRNKQILISVSFPILIFFAIYGGLWVFYTDKNFVYLTWSDSDTSTTINVNYHTKTEIIGATQVRYDSVSRNGDPARYRFSAQGKKGTLPGIERIFHSVQLTNLTPGKPYYFIVGNNEDGYSREYKFKTVPNDGKPFRFVSGGDFTGANRTAMAMSRQAAAVNPDFALVGGDMAHGNGYLENWDKWVDWLKMWQDTMITADGFLIPLVVALGNHEISKYGNAPLYFALFDQGLGDGKEVSYLVKKFGPDMVVFVLDSNIVNPHDDKQLEWMKTVFEKFKDVKYRLAVYHIAMYPANVDPNDRDESAGRKHWAPLFDAYGIQIAFEHHNHVYKRTKPLKANQIVSTGGTVYLGDGAWGSSVRKAEGDRWYIEKAGAENHVWVSDVSKKGVNLRAITKDGEVIDQVQF